MCTPQLELNSIPQSTDHLITDHALLVSITQTSYINIHWPFNLFEVFLSFVYSPNVLSLLFLCVFIWFFVLVLA